MPFVFNRAKGRVTELAERVNGNDPANSAFGILWLDSSGLESNATLIDKDTVSDLVSGTTNESAASGYVRKTLADTALTITYDDTNDRTEVDCADQTYTAVTGSAVAAAVFYYDNDTTAGTDANLVPLTYHEFALTPDGSDVTMQVANFFRAA